MVMSKNKSFSFVCRGGESSSTSKPLKKSRSLAFVVVKEEKERKKKKKKGGFWSKLLGMKIKDEDHDQVKKMKDDGGLMLQYSKTMKESSSTKWVLF